MLALVLLGLLSTTPDVLLRSEPIDTAPVVAQGIPREAMRRIENGGIAAAVFGVRGEWYQVSIGSKKAWLRKTPTMVFHTYPDLLTSRAPVLTQHWDAALYAEVGRNPAVSPSLRRALRAHRTVGVKILTKRMYNGGLWLQVETPVADACGKRPPKVATTTGWIPAYDRDGEPYVWFSLAGC